MRSIWKQYYGDLYNIDTQVQVEVHICCFGGVRRGSYFGGKPIRRTEVELRVGKLKNEKAPGKDEGTRELIKGGGDKVLEWIWGLCNMASESGVLSKNWRFAGIVPLCEGKGERTECSSWRNQ